MTDKQPDNTEGFRPPGVGDEAPPLVFVREYYREANREQDERRKNWMVPAGAMITAGILCGGFYAFKTGNQNLSQKLMRARVGAQGVTIAIMMGSLYFMGDEDIPWLPKRQKADASPPSSS